MKGINPSQSWRASSQKRETAPTFFSTLFYRPEQELTSSLSNCRGAGTLFRSAGCSASQSSSLLTLPWPPDPCLPLQ